MSLPPDFFMPNPRLQYHHNNRPSRPIDQYFGSAVTPEDLLTAAAPIMLPDTGLRPWTQLLPVAARAAGSGIKVDQKIFQLNLDVERFAPEEISVKTVDGYVVVVGEHEQKNDELGCIRWQFERRYALPEGTEPENVQAQLSSDGVLIITLPIKDPEAINDERSVTSTQTGPVPKQKDQMIQTEE